MGCQCPLCSITHAGQLISHFTSEDLSLPRSDSYVLFHRKQSIFVITILYVDFKYHYDYMLMGTGVDFWSDGKNRSVTNPYQHGLL